MATWTYRIFLKNSSPPQQHPTNSKHPICLLEPVCLNRTSTFSERCNLVRWIQVTPPPDPPGGTSDPPAGHWKLLPGRPGMRVWEFDPGKFTFLNPKSWRLGSKEFPKENWIILRFHVNFQRCIIPLKINAWKMTVPISTTGDFGCQFSMSVFDSFRGCSYDGMLQAILHRKWRRCDLEYEVNTVHPKNLHYGRTQFATISFGRNPTTVGTYQIIYKKHCFQDSSQLHSVEKRTLLLSLHFM